MKATEQHKIDLMLKLKAEGISNLEIAKQIGLHPETVKRLLRRKIPFDRDRIKRIHSQLVIDRLSMPLSEVAKKHNLNPNYISTLTSKHEKSKDFIRMETGVKRGTKKAPKPKKSTPKTTTKPKKIVENKDLITSLEKMQKGHVKLQKGETILPTRIPKAQRSVPMYDSKNTIKFVDLDDPRSNEEIRSAWKEEQEKKLRSLAS